MEKPLKHQRRLRLGFYLLFSTFVMTRGDSLWVGEFVAGLGLTGEVFGLALSTGVTGLTLLWALLEPSIL